MNDDRSTETSESEARPLAPNEMAFGTQVGSGLDRQSSFENDQEFVEFMFGTRFDDLARLVSRDNYNKGFKDGDLVSNPLYIPTKVMLMVTELAEGVEAHRAGGTDLRDNHLPKYSALGVELADTVIRILDLAGDLSLPVGEIVAAKLAYNRSRARAHGGKAY